MNITDEKKETLNKYLDKEINVGLTIRDLAVIVLCTGHINTLDFNKCRELEFNEEFVDLLETKSDLSDDDILFSLYDRLQDLLVSTGVGKLF